MYYLWPDDKDSAEFKEMSRKLSKLGINVIVTENDNSIPEMHLEINEDIFRKKTTRNAGPKNKPVKIDGRLSEITVEEARDLIRVFGREEAGKYLGISGKTLYRKLKEAEQFGWDKIF